MAEKEFIFEKTVYLTDTNLFGNTYFARYFDWQGMAREAFVKRLIGNLDEFLKSHIKLVTIQAFIKYHHEVTLYDEVVIKVRPENIKITTVELVFTYINKKTNQLVAEGRQKIGFVNATGQVIPLPNNLIEGWVNFKN